MRDRDLLLAVGSFDGYKVRMGCLLSLMVE